MHFTNVFIISFLGYLSTTPATAYPGPGSQSLHLRSPLCSLSSVPAKIQQLEKVKKNIAEVKSNLAIACSAVAAGKPAEHCHQGANVDVASELVQMISAQRSYEANKKVIDTASAAMCKIMNLRG
ncbi:hypothetical protein B0O99DRAFT_346074 [Bisporella sp. PMI_857]|nr:hypothetical protein B0O99DRAFT_346074 [Bisporella sp. PMI_857]